MLVFKLDHYNKARFAIEFVVKNIGMTLFSAFVNTQMHLLISVSKTGN